MPPRCVWRRKLHVFWRWFDERIAEKMEATTLSNTGGSLTSGFIISALIVAAAVVAQANGGSGSGIKAQRVDQSSGELT